MGLVHNWCKHARVEKSGGTGLVEMETRLPIGHHYMACDHAPAGGMATWDFADAALDFHDRNCFSCTQRVAVRLPNLTSLLQQRETHRKRIEDERRVEQERAANERAARQLIRQTLRSQLNVVPATIVDHLEELDSDTPGEAAAQLLGVARLAPETFTPAIIEHCFSLLEDREGWFDEIGLHVLNELGDDPVRLTRCALLSLGEYRSIQIAADIINTNSGLIDESLLANALPALVGLASPEQNWRSGQVVEEVGPLLASFRAHGVAVEAAIRGLLDQRDPYLISAGARAIKILSFEDRTIASRHTRSFCAKLARAHLLIDHRETGYSGDDEVIYLLQEALALSFEASPEDSDVLIAEFIAGASSEGEERLYKTYGIVLGGRQRERGRPRSNTAALVAFRRLIRAATTATNQNVLRDIQGTFSYVDDELSFLPRSELPALLGSAIILDDRIQRFDQDPVTDNSFFGKLERQNRREMLVDLQNALVKGAAKAANGDNATTEYVDFLSRIPEGKDRLRSVLVKNSAVLMDGPDGLNAVLPAIYTAMVCSSSLVRAAAAKAIGKLSRRGRDDVPDLLYEAFSALLGDPYVIVHRAAVDALEHFELPHELDLRAKGLLGECIEVYSVGHTDDRFLLQCIELYLRKYATAEQKRGTLGRFFVALIDRLKPDIVAEKIAWLRHDLREAEGFAALVLRTLEDSERHYRQDDILRALSDLPDDAIRTHKAHIEAIATAADVDGALPPSLVETLTRVGAWEEAARINQAIFERVPDTTEKRAQKLAANLDRIAAMYEEAIALGKLDILPELAAEWRTTEIQIEKHQITYTRRSSPFAVLSQAFPTRISAVEALVQAIQTRTSNAEQLRQVASHLDRTGLLYGKASTASIYAAFAELLRIVALLVEWRAGVLEAAQDSDRFLRAAKEQYRLWLTEYGVAAPVARLVNTSVGIDAVSSIDEVGSLCQTLACTPLPLGAFARDHPHLRAPSPEGEDGEERDGSQELAIAFLRFVIDGLPADDTHFLTPGETHDLEIEVRVSRWPENANQLRLLPLTIEPKSTYDFPVFEFTRPAGNPPFVMQQRGRAVLNAPQSLKARPFEFRYTASFSPLAAEQPVIVVGQRTLRIEGIDLARSPVTGYHGIDCKLLEIRNELRVQPLITVADLDNVLTVLTPLCSLAGRAPQDALFRDTCNEGQFQAEVRDELRRHPAIASELDEHPHAAGGITDLSFRGIRIELKFVSNTRNALSLTDCERFTGQTASYIVGTGKRVGILCVLDNSPKRSAPFPAEEGIGITFQHAENKQISVVTILIQGNLAQPSQLSH